MSEQENERIKRELAELKKNSDETKRAEDKKRYDDFRKKYYKYIDITDEDLEDPIERDDKGRPQPEKGSNRDPATWKVVRMKDDATLFKVVDNKGINVADLFRTEAGAQKFIDDFKKQPSPLPQPEPGPGTPGSYPYPAIGQPMQSTQRGPTTRHYASGKPDDETIEKNVKDITFKNYQWVCYVTMNEIEHPDNISEKLGGTHMGSGWFDHGVSFGDGEGQTCLGTEPNHPDTNTCVIKGPQIGEILGKKVGIATTYFKDQNYTELWTDLGEGWKKQCEAKDVDGFNPNSEIGEAQLRIDGFKKGSVPTIHSAVVTEIAPRVSNE